MPNDSTDDNDKRMLDTNILVYAFTAQDPHKQQIALALVEQLLQEENLMLSAQVLNEFYSVLTRSSRKTPMSHDEAVTALRRLTTSGAHVVSLNEATTFLAFGRCVAPWHELLGCIDLGGSERGRRHHVVFRGLSAWSRCGRGEV
jgi:predicted nucleic acid-binding protein